MTITQKKLLTRYNNYLEDYYSLPTKIRMQLTFYEFCMLEQSKFMMLK